MRLRRESADIVTENSEEYKTAVKSVIRCQIQSLLQKLAIETGEESIVISTNISAGTYNHLGSLLGNEYLEGRGTGVQNLCENFTTFCAGLTQDCRPVQFQKEDVKPVIGKSKVGLPAPKSSRKRQHDQQSLPNSPPLKRRPDFIGQETKEDNSSQIIETPSSHKSKKADESQQCAWIKIEPVDEYDNKGDEVDGDAPKEQESSSDRDPKTSTNSIINRPKSLIPLANISKHSSGGGLKQGKTAENIAKPDGTESLPTEKSILRSLYENQPVFPLSAYANISKESDTSLSNENQAALNEEPILQEQSVEQFSSGTSENLVLSGYYDSDSVPSYRHRTKHLTNLHAKDNKKGKKEKVSPVKTELTIPTTGSIDFHLRTFESGGRLVYACDVCKRELSHLTSYRRHMKLHTMERPHKCPVCEKGFIRKYHCIDHVNKHHKGVSFDPETLNLTDNVDTDNLEQSALSESLDGSTSEYNYTLDQSLMDDDQSINSSIDQSASTMLSELAKSAAQSQLNQSKQSIYESSLSVSQSAQDTQVGNQSESLEEKEAIQIDVDVEEEANGMSESESVNQSNNSSPLSENGASARKTQVAQGIQAIIAHLKKNKQKLACDSNGAAQPIQVENSDI